MSCNKQIPSKYSYKGKRLGRIYHLVKYGYDEDAVWTPFLWFTRTMKSVLTQYKEKESSVPILMDNYPADSFDESREACALRDQNEQMWNDIVSRMIELLDLMDENSTLYEEYDYMRTKESMSDAKEEFF